MPLDLSTFKPVKNPKLENVIAFTDCTFFLDPLLLSLFNLFEKCLLSLLLKLGLEELVLAFLYLYFLSGHVRHSFKLLITSNEVESVM